MAERPILFSAPMVRALLAGTKTQTRRVVKPQPTEKNWCPTTGVLVREQHRLMPNSWVAWDCPYGQPGDRLWVRETWQAASGDKRHARIIQNPRADLGWVEYAATCEDPPPRWRPSIHMPRWASRITLEITAIRVERLNDISEADVVAEGVEPMFLGETPDMKRLGARVQFKELWEQINGLGSWAANPWVWVVEFRRVK